MVSTGERYLNLVQINLGEAIVELANQRQRGAAIGADLVNVRLSLMRAFAASLGQVFIPPRGSAESEAAWQAMVDSIVPPPLAENLEIPAP